jgi:transcriptional/translational regulatory protein YebC/TACO1
MFIEGSTDNKNRTVGNVRYAFTKHGGNLGNDGCVAWMFHDQGIITIEESKVDDFDALLELALENGASDIVTEEGMVTLTTEYEDFVVLRDALQQAGYDEFVTDELTKVAENTVTPELDDVKKTMRIIDALEDDDDVENIYHNLELSDEVAEALENE